VREVLLLHYKKLGLEYEIARSAELRKGLGSTDIENEWGYQYLLSPEEITERFRRTAELAKPVPRRAWELWEEELSKLREDIGALGTENERLSFDRSACQTAILTLQDRLAATNLEVARLREDLAFRETRYRDLESSAARAGQALSVAERELQRVYRSRSWKITQPLRSLHDGLVRRHSDTARRAPVPLEHDDTLPETARENNATSISKDSVVELPLLK
jgi:chromosome segregation ATPase